MPELTTVFAGSPEFAAHILDALNRGPFAPVAVFTQPDRAKGRGRKVKPNPVKTLAQSLNLPVEQPATLAHEDAQACLKSYAPDVLIVAAYGLILPKAVLKIPTYGCLNVHASMLPRWRGAAPIERAIMAGDTSTGVCIMDMEAGLDTGGVYASEAIDIPNPVDTLKLEGQLAESGQILLHQVLAQFANAARNEEPVPTATPQNDALATYAHKLTAADRALDWQQPAEVLARQIQALCHRLPVRVKVNECGVQLLAANCIEQNGPVAESVAPGTLLDVSKSGLRIQCATDILQITSLKVERGKGKVIDPSAAINGFSDLFFPGAKFTNP